MSAAEPNSGAAEFLLIPERHAVSLGGQEVVVTATQFRLLAVLMGEPGRVFSRAELVERGIGDLVSERTVDVHIAELRRKLGAAGTWIQTVRRAGYQFRIAGPTHLQS